MQVREWTFASIGGSGEATQPQPGNPVQSSSRTRLALTVGVVVLVVLAVVAVAVAVPLAVLAPAALPPAAPPPAAPPPAAPAPLAPPTLPPSPPPPQLLGSLYAAVFLRDDIVVTSGYEGSVVDVRLQRTESGLTPQEMEISNIDIQGNHLALSGCTLVPDTIRNAEGDRNYDPNTNFLKTHENVGAQRVSLTRAVYYSMQLDKGASQCIVTMKGNYFRWSSGGEYVSNIRESFTLQITAAPSVACMPSTATVSNNNEHYTIDGSSEDRYLGPKQYTFTDVPCDHAFQFVAHGTGSYGCVPAAVSWTQTMGGLHYCGTVVYDFSICSATQSSEFQCAYHGRMRSGIPRVTVTAACSV